ncbi:NADP-dependent oxidoreductase [Catalinimonas niigatensis]|uniref:NADP-dependent oxidoreductase n=1 Tax=Catalinimonas niigatensis TaxID=1397264 RepID=UPI002AA2A2FC|nr:NADP-dependent oxidoreductase [Catalinimonas niigatensis]WPP53685.1 NADP-dependent oxidoreductase [Catalinimonas niigatensis]
MRSRWGCRKYCGANRKNKRLSCSRIAGSDEKINHLIQDFGFDAGINYKISKDMNREISEKCPNGIDIYFDNVGGKILDTIMHHINEFARIVNCGAISNYNKERIPNGMRLEGILVEKRAKMQGFSVLDHTNEFTETVEQLSEWLQENKIQYDETIRRGFDNIPKAFIEIFAGKNMGKMLVEM